MALDWIVHCYASKYAFENKMVLLEGNIFDDEFNISVSFFFLCSSSIAGACVVCL